MLRIFLAQLPQAVSHDYKRMANMISSTIQSRVAKIVFRRPPQFPNAVAQLMENGDLRIKLSNAVIVRNVKSGEVVNILDGQASRKEPVTGPTLRKVGEVYEYLYRLEQCLSGMGDLKCFPHVFSVLTPEAALQATPVSVAPTASATSRGSLQRRPFNAVNSSSQSSFMPRSAPGAFERQFSTATVASAAEQADENAVPFKFKLDKNNRTIAIIWNDGRKLRQSTMNEREFIFSDAVRRKEIRFNTARDNIPDTARQLLDVLTPELSPLNSRVVPIGIKTKKAPTGHLKVFLVEMVYGRKEEWSNLERLALLNTYFAEVDWERRAAAMAKKYAAKRSAGFFSPKNCHLEFDRILSTPYPGHEPSTSGQFSYSHKVIIDGWRTHYRKVIDEEIDRKNEEAMIEVRRLTAIIERIMNNQMSVPEMEQMLAELKLEDAEKSKDPQWCRVVSAYYNRMNEVFRLRDQQGTSAQPMKAPELPPTKILETAPIGASTAFRSPSPSAPASPIRSPVHSPIRRVSDALRDAVPLVVESPKSMSPRKEPPVQEEKTPAVAVKAAKNKPEAKNEKPEEDLDDSKTVETPRGRGRPPRTLSKLSMTPVVAAKQEVEKTPEPQTVAGGKAKKNVSIEIKESPETTQKRSKRPSNSLPPPAVPSAGGKSRRSRGPTPVVKEEEEDIKNVELEKTSSRGKSVAKSEASTVSVAATPVPPPSSEPRTVEVQTNITIRSNHTFSPPSGRRSAGTPSVALRKSSRRSETRASMAPPPTPPSSSSSSTHNTIACQTGRVEFDRDDTVIVNYESQPKLVAPVVELEKRGKAKKDDRDRNNDSDMLSEDFEEEEESNRRLKSDGKRDITLVIETDAATGQAILANNKTYKLMDTASSNAGESPSKRTRKDEKQKEEMTNLKYQFNNMCRALTEHKHSGIFSHPVQEKDAPGYTSAIHRRMDLQTLRREVEGNIITSRTQFLIKTYTMFANAVMFNSTGHDVNTYAKTMVQDVMPEINGMSSDERRPGHSRRSKINEELRNVVRERAVEPLPIVNLGEPGEFRTMYGRRDSKNRRRVAYVPESTTN
ncbi:unnamed protein product [Caenorhabditis auriculariae]|uniref:Bromo domain-containing protein n=1 Tax=Caenorhabditis auriculariae TaxID=2777116 RepID=A0A8S1HIF8_9PELO|nr:unnamed protein product [Caenorhabditis auriculariae]